MGDVGGDSGSGILCNRAGSKGRDAVLGGNEVGPKGGGDKALSGGPGRDFVGGGNGGDALSGGPGGDLLIDGGFREQDRDAIAGGGGRDAIGARNRPASRDVIDCGGGFDRVLVDSEDITNDCERKFTSARKAFRSIRGEGYFQPLNSL